MTIAPPKSAQNWLRLNPGFTIGWVPLRDATLIVAPEERPYSALSLLVTTWNCEIESGGGWMIWLSNPRLLSP